ncbi:ribonuclease Z [Brochothrix thermosphacta]|uniref:ribonuclease Z n=1 Tax=Brochothrix thermosphacta TaxID=2756 RepID=UPI00083F5FE9|nr:ribonuclease Z [Brochothrix thermosphacta]ODJ60335.1 ribonuclease Z [Brochothrix thermosphacta]
MELTFLGTGAGVPAKTRNVTAIALQLLDERSVWWLFDCGEATQHQLLKSSLKPGKIEKIFITHLHGDHIFGMPGLLSSRSFQGGDTALTVYGPKGIRAFIETSLKVSQTHLSYPLIIEEMQPGVIFEDEQFKVETALLSHGIDSYGFRIEERDKVGKLDVAGLTKLGVKPGPVFKVIKDGGDVTLEDGSVISGKDFVAPSIKGRIVTILGDTRPTDTSVKLAQGANVLVHEATFEADKSKMARAYYHSSTTQAATIALKANVTHLILTHISSRYMFDDLKKLAQEARSVFENTDIADDFSTFEIPYQK